jgi:hypothetical protein
VLASNAQFGSKVKAIFLHLPIHSIYHWNFHKQFGSGVWKFKNDDRLLRQPIEVVNNYECSAHAVDLYLFSISDK